MTFLAESDLIATTWLSLRIATCATLLAMLSAVPLAYLLARRRFPLKSALEALLLLPLVLPPTVVGYLILGTLGARGWIGRYLYDAFAYSIAFRFEGAVLAAWLVAFPLLYLPARGAFAGVEREMEDIARLNGANRWQLFWHVSLPLARRGIVSGLLLAFARALGEFGATLMVFGWMEDQLTLPLSVYAAATSPESFSAGGSVALLMAISLVVVVIYNASTSGRRERD
jgi:molybdate transport system permease protein